MLGDLDDEFLEEGEGGGLEVGLDLRLDFLFHLNILIIVG